MYSSILSGSILGVEAIPVRVEVDISPGLPSINMVGLLGSEVRESRERVWAALKNIKVSVPPARITVNLSPADLHKFGTSYDLPIAVGILSSMESLPKDAAKKRLFLGELGLNGEIRPVRGVLPIVQKAASLGVRECIIPAENVAEGAVVPGITVRGASLLTDVLTFLRSEDESLLPATRIDPAELFTGEAQDFPEDFADVRGQEGAKRAAMISAAGFHSLLMTGPPGAGKSMIAKRIPGILPPLTLEESLEVTAVYSIAGALKPGQSLVTARGFQSPHHSLSRAALIGGGNGQPRPGAISLAHRSVLFLDELPELARDSIDSLRQPLEERSIRISRANYSIVYPADFLLVCAMNPCPCGFYPNRSRCRCTEPMLRRYLGKVSGPILDRIDLCVELQAVERGEIRSRSSGMTSAQMRERVTAARAVQEERFRGTPYRFNSELSARDLEEYCRLGTEEARAADEIYEKLQLSARSYHRILRVARTIADLEEARDIRREHLLEAICYRPDLKYWIP